MTDVLEQPSSLQLRAMLQDMVRKDLLGPAGGPDEIIDESNVRGRYIVGMLAPKGQSMLPDENDQLAHDGSDEQDGKSAAPIPQAASMLPSAIGLTFTVAEDTPALQITVRWGKYRRVEMDIKALGSSADESGEENAVDDEYLPEADEAEPEAGSETRRVWKRIPVEAASDPFPLDDGYLKPWSPDPDNPDIYVRTLVRKRDHAWTITTFLINAQSEPQSNKDEAWVFQPELVVRAPDGAPVFIKRNLPAELRNDHPEDRAIEMLYRQKLEFAVGHGVAASAELAAGHWDRAVKVRTEIIPTHEVEQMAPPTAEDIPLLAKAVLDMGTLAETQQGGFSAALDPLTEAYAAWIADLENRLSSPAPDLQAYQSDAAAAVDDCRKSLARIREGIALLDNDPLAAQAFRFANRAMALQRVHTIFSQAVRRGEEPDLAAIDVPGSRSWRPFQLAFILLNLPGLVDPTHPDRSHPTSAKADLLWFPTGGGKTEAYLGVAAFTMAIRRLQGELGGLSGGAGVSVLMRYTLRLLTLQQFQRAAALICACEVIRREDQKTWGAEPFRIGLWVGRRSTPNWTKESEEAVKRVRNTASDYRGGMGTPAQLTNCPWCGQPIRPGRDIEIDSYPQGSARTIQYCSDPQGNCPFSRKGSPREGLPILVVDEEIYRRLPALLIATVDKFAQMPWKGETQMLFGRVDARCPRHGYRSPEIEDSDSHPKRGSTPGVRTQPLSRLRPPDLIIQDELHLISGPLGTLVGLYETAVDALSSWELDGKTIYPKVIASTATVRRARDQVYSLFQREVKIFPAPGLDADDNFFARRVPSSEQAPGRSYIGVCAPGTRLKTVLIRVYAAYMAAAQVLYENYGRAADPWMTLVGYFNSMRELGGMRRVVDDALRERLRKMDRRGLARRYINPWSVEELTSRKDASDIPYILDRLEAVFDPVAAEERKQRNKAGEKTDFARNPFDIVLATNMISVGVDVSRLGLMVVASQPKATAEYIQATSRVGRAFPGIVCTVYNWARPRDLSHYERFEHYHATFYQQVEALSVTPFSPRARDRGLSAVLVAFLRLLGDAYNANDRPGELDRAHPYVRRALYAIVRRAGLVNASCDTEAQVKQELDALLDQWLARAATTRAPGKLGYKPKKDSLTLPLLNAAEGGSRDPFTCLNSLRDVEPGAPLVLLDYGMDREPGETVVEEVAR
jgi:hypothetical protein